MAFRQACGRLLTYRLPAPAAERRAQRACSGPATEAFSHLLRVTELSPAQALSHTRFHARRRVHLVSAALKQHRGSRQRRSFEEQQQTCWQQHACSQAQAATHGFVSMTGPLAQARRPFAAHATDPGGSPYANISLRPEANAHTTGPSLTQARAQRPSKLDPREGLQRPKRRIGESVELVARVGGVIRPRQALGATVLKLETEHGTVECHAVAPPIYVSDSIRVRANWQLQEDGSKWCLHVGTRFGGIFTHSDQRQQAQKHNLLLLEELETSILDPQAFLQNVPFVGQATARALIRAAKDRGVHVFNLIESGQHTAARGIGKAKAARIRNTWLRVKTLRSLIRLLLVACEGLDVPLYDILLCSQDLYESYGTEAKAILLQNPYCLLSVDNHLPVQVAQRVASRHTGASPSRADVIEGLCLASLRYKEMDGAPHAKLGGLISSVMGRLQWHKKNTPGFTANGAEQTPAALKEEIKDAIHDSRHLVVEQGGTGMTVTRGRFKEILEFVTTNLRERAEGAAPWDVHQLELEGHGEIELLSPSQRAAIKQLLSRKVGILSGFPGTGKTTLISGLVRVLQAAGKEVRLVAPTGRAATRITAAIAADADPALTIHSFAKLGIFRDFGDSRDHKQHAEVDAVIVDEASMLSIDIAYGLFKALSEDTAVYFIGDPDQLPAIGGSGIFNVATALELSPVQLTEVHRQQAADSLIQRVSRDIASGQPDICPVNQVPTDTDFAFMFCEEKDLSSRIVQLVTEEIPDVTGLDPLHDIQVLTPLRTRKLASTSQLNPMLQKAFLEMNEGEGCRLPSTRGFHLHDKVIQTVNSRTQGIFNGEMGVISAIYTKARHVLDVTFNRDKSASASTLTQSDVVVGYSPFELDALQLGYAITIHKAQGSEFPAVVVPITLEHGDFLNRNLLYTAVTRARQLVVCVGHPAAWANAVKRTHNLAPHLNRHAL